MAKDFLLPMLEGEKLHIAVLPLVAGEGVSPGVGPTITSVIQDEMVKSRRFDVLDRGSLEEILKEKEFQLAGYTEMEYAVEIGRILSMHKM